MVHLFINRVHLFNIDPGRSYSVVYHAETKVMYVAGDVKYGDVFTVLVNPDGTPMIWRE